MRGSNRTKRMVFILFFQLVIRATARSFLEESSNLRASRNAISNALTVGYKWCEMCIRSDCRCNFQEEECDHCIADDQYNNYRDEAIKAGKMKRPRNKFELNNNDLKILANGPKDGEALPPNAQLDSLDGNAADRRKRDILTRDLAMRISTEDEKQDRIEAETAASILYNSPSIKNAQNRPLSEDNAKDASLRIDDKAQKAKDAATNEEDKELNEKKHEEEEEEKKEKSESGKTEEYRMPYDCTQDYDKMDEKTMAWCTGRHRDGTPIELDGITLV